MFTGRVVGPEDPGWLPTDRGYALAWRQDKAETCRCGTRRDEWADDRDAYISDHVYCEGCARLAEEQANLPTDEDGRARPGYLTFLVTRESYSARHEHDPDPDRDD